MNTVLFKTITRSFYQQHVGFFLLVLLVAFGLFRGEDHLIFADLGLQSWPFLLGLFFLVWVLYTLRVAQFVLASFTDPKQEFLYLLRLLPLQKQLLLLIPVQYALLQPVLYYGAFVALRGISTQYFGSSLSILLFMMGLLLVPVGGYVYALQRPNQTQNRKFRFSRLLSPDYAKPYPSFFLLHLLKDQKLSFFLTKLLSAFFIVGVCRLFSTDSYDHRLISIGILLSAMTHTALAGRFHRFEHESLVFLRNLPLSMSRRFFLQSLSYALLLLPEIVLLAKNLPESVSYSYVFSGSFFLWGLVLAWHHFLYIQPGNPEKASMVLFSGFFLSLLTIMFKVPGAIIGLLLLGIAAALFRKGYPKVEYPSEN